MAEECNTSPPVIKAASTCVWNQGRVLLARRAKVLGKGLWSLPGGKLEPGETAAEAALRELQEETGIHAELLGVIGIFPIRTKDFTFEITCFAARYSSGKAIAMSDADAVEWVLPEAFETLALAPNTAEAVKLSRKFITV